MTTSIYGWCGKILKIDLSELRISELKTMDYADRFLGGRGIATRIYWEEVRPSVRAFDPENHLIFMTGPLGATGVITSYSIHYTKLYDVVANDLSERNLPGGGPSPHVPRQGRETYEN